MKFSKIYAGIMFLLVALAACKKNDSPDSASTTINPSDAKALSQNIKVNHGKTVEGTMPMQSGADLKLDPAPGNKTLFAAIGRYAVIRPTVVKGVIAGYYLRIVGSDQNYFKIDFSKPISGRKKAVLPHETNLGLSKKVTDDNPDFADSVIIIKLPENIEPGTFCVEYAAYNMDGSVSNIIKECVTVTTLGGDKNLVGKWELYKEKYNNEDWEYYPLSDWWSNEYYKCVNDKLEFSYDGDTSGVRVDVNSYGYRNDYVYMSFATNGIATLESYQVELEINKEKSSCTNFVYDSTVNNANRSYVWSLDSVRKKMIFIWEKSSPDDFGLWESDFKYIDKDHFELYFKGESTAGSNRFYEEWYEFVRK